ncbi:hypothetical protein ApDm4_0229 [Acetobacter pomorum]|nr:hypothetical protein ApDm4_0229 [Acetobacter pomorum]
MFNVIPRRLPGEGSYQRPQTLTGAFRMASRVENDTGRR